MSEPIRRVAFLGLGRMGVAMARRILDNGYELTVYNRTASRARPLVDAGARVAATPREAVQDADAVLTMLTDDRSVLALVEGEDGILAGLPTGAVHLGASTISPRGASRLAELHARHGSSYVSAPVLGRPDAAAAGQLLTMAAGPAAHVDRAEPLLLSYSRKVERAGTDPAAANSLKLAMNYGGVTIIDIIGQIYVFCDKSGVDPELTNQMVEMMFGKTPFNSYVTKIRDQAFDHIAIDLRTGLKDVNLMLEAAEDTLAPLPFASNTRDRMLAALALGLDDLDWSSFYKVTRRNAGLE